MQFNHQRSHLASRLQVKRTASVRSRHDVRFAPWQGPARHSVRAAHPHHNLNITSRSPPPRYVDFDSDLSKRYPTRPGTCYVFPGYAILHRTQREAWFEAGSEELRQTLPRRYSIGMWFPVKQSAAEKVDKWIHDTFPLCDDEYSQRWGGKYDV